MIDLYQKFQDTLIWIIGGIFFLINILYRYFFTKQKKRFNYYESSKKNLKELNDTNIAIDIKSKGSNLIHPILITFKFTNNGEISILEKDWEKPLNIHFKNIRIIKGIILESSDKNIKAEVFINENIATITFGVLNPKDFVFVEILVDGVNLEYELNYRINGIQKIENIEYVIPPLSFIKQALLTLGTFITVIVAIVIGFVIIVKLIKWVAIYIPSNIKNYIYYIFGIMGIGFLVFIVLFTFFLVVKDKAKKPF